MDGKPRNAMPAPSTTAANINAGRMNEDACGTMRLPEVGLEETDYHMRQVRFLQRNNLVDGKFHRFD
jgi:hypothetical protein